MNAVPDDFVLPENWRPSAPIIPGPRPLVEVRATCTDCGEAVVFHPKTGVGRCKCSARQEIPGQ